MLFSKSKERLSQEIEEIEAGRGDRCEEKMIMGHKNRNAKKEDEKMSSHLVTFPRANAGMPKGIFGTFQHSVWFNQFSYNVYYWR